MSGCGRVSARPASRPWSEISGSSIILNFDSLRKLAAVPFQRHSDYYDVPQRLPATGLRWAMVARDEDELKRRAERVGAHGSIVDFEGLKIFLPDPAASDLATGDLLKAVRGPL